MPLPQENFYNYTLADALEWPEDERIELIEGNAVMMAPPKRIHQEICFEIGRQLGNFLESKRCKVYPAPFAVRLFEQDGEEPEDVDTMVEPDITVVCDPDKLDEIGCKGAPDMVIEILSPSTARHDRVTKYRLYERAGVREYWIVDPDTKTVNVHLLENGQYHSPITYTGNATVPVSLWDGFIVDLSTVFTE